MHAPANQRFGSHFFVAWVGLTLLAFGPSPGWAQSNTVSGVRFDVPQVAEAVRVTLADSPHDHEDQAEMLVAVDLTVSVIVDSLSAPRVDQLLIEIRPRGGTAMVADYAPRTELASEYTGGIEVQQTDESNHSLALTLDACYPPLASGKLSGAKGEKNIASTKFNRVAPLHLIAASGTTHRGRGVYFKFRSTDQQIIEGDRLLSLTFRVPGSWRGELLDVLIQGDSHPRGFSSNVASLTGITPKPERVGVGRFLVATYRGDDPQGRQLARQLADAEAEMRHRFQAVSGSTGASPLSSPAALLRHVSHRIDWNHSGGLQQKAAVSLHRALAGTLDPHGDRDFNDLPTEARIGCLNYLDVRREYLNITRQGVASAQKPERLSR